MRWTPVLLVANIALVYHFGRKLMVSQTELAAQLTALKEQNDKATAEQQAALASLQTALDAAGNTSPEVDAALQALKDSIQRDDDLNPDAPSA